MSYWSSDVCASDRHGHVDDFIGPLLDGHVRGVGEVATKLGGEIFVNAGGNVVHHSILHHRVIAITRHYANGYMNATQSFSIILWRMSRSSSREIISLQAPSTAASHSSSRPWYWLSSIPSA